MKTSAKGGPVNTLDLGIPREHVLNNLVAHLGDLRARAAKGEKVQDRISATEKRIKSLNRRVA